MADLNLTRGDDDTVPDAALAGGPVPGRVTEPDMVIRPTAPVTDSDHLVPAATHAAAPGTIAQVNDPDLARLQIEQTRARMSDTIEQIEEALVRKRAQVHEKLDVMAPVRRKARENAYPLLGGVFLAGLVLGYLTGDSGDEDLGARPAVREFGMAQDVKGRAAYSTHAQERAELWERRARRLMEVANRQEAELMALRGGEERPRRGLLRRRRQTVQPLHEEFGGEFAAGAMGATGGLRGEYDGMPLHEADSYPPRDDGYNRDPLPAPI